MPQSIQDSLRDLLYLARNADVPALRKEKANLELRLSAINNILAWHQQLHEAVDIDAAPAPGTRPPVTSHSPKAPGANPGPLYDHDRNPTITENASPPKRKYTRRQPQPELPPRCVDKDDPPEIRVDPDDPAPDDTGVEETEDNVLESDSPEAIETVKEIAAGSAEKKRFAFADLMSKIVMYLGKNGQSKGASIWPSIGITRGYFGLLMADARVKVRVRRVALGVYELTEAGHEMYEGLSSPKQESWR